MRYAQFLLISFLVVTLVFGAIQRPVGAQLDHFPGNRLGEPDFFPLGVWLQVPENATEYKKLGINLFVGLWQGPTREQLALLKEAKMPVISHQNKVGLNDPNNHMIIGWLQKDEPDNAQRIKGENKLDPPIAPGAMIKRYKEIQAADPSRPILLNLGQGVAWDLWHGRGPRTNHPEDYKEYVKAADIVSFDMYPVTHRDATVRGRLDMIAKGVDRLVKWTDDAKPVWAVIAAGHSNKPSSLRTGDQVRNQVWLAIIHGAKGIVYFVHQLAPVFVEAALLQNENLSKAVKSINMRITSLAKVLRSASLTDVVITENVVRGKKAENVTSVTSMIKRDACHLYIFAGSRSGLSTAAMFHVKPKELDVNIEVLDENRSLKLTKGRFQDAFDPYAVHLYRLSYLSPECSKK